MYVGASTGILGGEVVVERVEGVEGVLKLPAVGPNREGSRAAMEDEPGC